MENKEKQKNEPRQFMLFKKVWTIDRYNFYEYLSVMLDSWVTISESLESVGSKVKNIYFKEKINELITYVSSWDSFSKAMKKVPQIFDLSEISIIESWETTGSLSDSLARLSDELKKKHDLRSKIKWALTYPIIIFSFLLLAVIVVLAYVIPSIKPLFDTAEVDLPIATKALIFTSDFIVNNFLVLLLFLFSLFVLWVGYKSTEKWRASIDNTLLSLPLIWVVYRNYILSSISSTLGSLIWSWVNVMKALTLTWKTTNNVVYESLFVSITNRVSKWEKIVDSIQAVDKANIYFTTDFLQMLSVWERTANLENVSKKINAQYTREVDYSLANLTKWIEPIAILVAWIFVLWFAFAIFGAILKVTQTVG